MSQSQIKALTARVSELEGQLTNLQQTMVNVVASQLQALFTNKVMLDSIAHSILITGANALAFKASQSNERAPELTVLEGYIPGALRTILNEDGSMTVEQQLKGAVNAGGQWESATEDYQEKGILDSFAQLMSAYGAQAGRVYYITDTVTASKHREKLAKELASNVTAAEADDGKDGGEIDLPELSEGEDDGVCLELALQADQSKTTSVLLPVGSLVVVQREGEEFSTQVEEVQDGDVALITEVDQVVAYVVTGSSMVQLPCETADGEEHITNGTFHSGDTVEVVLKPWNAEVEGQVELAGDELSGKWTVFERVTTIVDGVEVVKAAWELLPQDVVLVTRNEQIVKEVIVSVNVVTNVPVEMVS